MELHKNIGNSTWLEILFELRLLADPARNLLWYPLPADTVAELRDIVSLATDVAVCTYLFLLGQTISSTGFSDSQKHVLQALICSLGGRYLGELAKVDTTVLITAE